MKQYLLNIIFERNREYFKSRIAADSEEILGELYDRNPAFFQNRLVDDFTGYMPKDVREPALNIFRDNSDAIQRWCLWMSNYFNRKLMSDRGSEKLHGMLIMVKALYSMAETESRRKAPQGAPEPSKVPEVPWLAKAMEGVSDFVNEVKKKKDEPAAEKVEE